MFCFHKGSSAQQYGLWTDTEDNKSFKMETAEYIEYFEDGIKVEIKPEDDDLELSQNRKYSEYFEEDVKEDIVDEKNPHSILVKYKCDICSKSYKSKGTLRRHIQSLHEGIKYPCNQCE